MEIRKQVREFITSNFYVPDPVSLADDASLIDRGVIDSTGVLEMVSFIEEAFGVPVEDHEILPENLDSIERICSFVTRKQTQAA